MDACARGVALAHDDPAQGLADGVVAAPHAAPEPLVTVRLNRLQAVQDARRVAQRDQQHVAVLPDAVGLYALVRQIGVVAAGGCAAPPIRGLAGFLFVARCLGCFALQPHGLDALAMGFALGCGHGGVGLGAPR